MFTTTKNNTGYFKGRCHHCTEETERGERSGDVSSDQTYITDETCMLLKRHKRHGQNRSDGAMKPINRGFFFFL